MIVIAAILLTQASHSPLGDHPATYASKMFGLRVSYPANWKVEESTSYGPKSVPPNLTRLRVEAQNGVGLVLELSTRKPERGEQLSDLTIRPDRWKAARPFNSLEDSVDMFGEAVTVGNTKFLVSISDNYEGHNLQESLNFDFLTARHYPAYIGFSSEANLTHDQILERLGPLSGRHHNSPIRPLTGMREQLPLIRAILESITLS